MDFALTEEQQATRDLARQILTDRETHEHLKEIEAGGEGFDRDTWAELAKAGLVGIAVAEEAGGRGLGFVALCQLLEEAGRTVAPVPVVPTVVLGALPIAHFGSEEQRQRWLPGVVNGDTVLTAALVELGTDPLHPSTTATREGSGFRLDGVKVCVPAGLSADAVLVPAASAEGSMGIFVVDPTASGVTVERQDTTSGIPQARIELDGVGVTDADTLVYATSGSEALEWVIERATAALCAVATGVCEQAL